MYSRQMADDAPNVIRLTLGLPAAQVLLHWLTVVPSEVIPVTHPAERQALADLLSALEWAAAPAAEVELENARDQLLADAGAWTAIGVVYPGPPDAD